MLRSFKSRSIWCQYCGLHPFYDRCQFLVVPVYSPFAIEKVPTLNLHEVLWGPEGKGYALLSQVVILR